MFEDNAVLDFGDELSVKMGAKRPSPPEAPLSDPVKKPKVNVVKRKFPGPAGILSTFTPVLINKKNGEIPCTQTSLSVFEKSPWLEMSRDYTNLLDKFNIKWIQTNLNQTLKAPFLGAVIQNLECVNEQKAVHVVLKDLSGEIQGTFPLNFYDEYSNDLVPGAVIVLKQFSVLRTNQNKNCHLTITAKNLVTIYTRSKDEEESEVRIIKIKKVSSEDFIQTVPKVSKSQKQELEIQPRLAPLVNKVTTPIQENCNIFEDDLVLPDNFEDCLINQNQSNQVKKFNFKKTNVTISCSQVSVKTSEEHSEIWQNALDGVDADSLFEDF